MSKKQNQVIELEAAVIKFAGDSGDGMQMTGSQFSETSAFIGNDLATFPDYPAEIRAPQGTVAGVSGFQVHIGHKDIHTSGDLADVLVAMNPAALKYNLPKVKIGGTILLDATSFDEKSLKKAGYSENPLENGSLDGFNIIAAPITDQTRIAIQEMGLDAKTVDKTKNQFASGILYYMFNREMTSGEQFLKDKFGKKPEILEANIKVLHAGYNYAENVEALATTYIINANKSKKGKFRNLTGNQATAWGLMAAAERAHLPLFLGSYPITPATEILQELAKHKELGVKAFQAEDEIAGINSAIGAAFTGSLATTTTSGPGLSLKSEALGLAVMTELPLVIVNVQRGGPSTGLPTKTEQADLLQALYGRNGEAPIPIVAASSPADCFDFAFAASKIALEHMTPVILLTDGYLANGSELWKIQDMNALPEIHPPFVSKDLEKYLPFKRNEETLVREWAVPGMDKHWHRVGGLEKENITGAVSHNPLNHELMIKLRGEKVQRIANFIPEQTILGNKNAKLLVVGWGGTKGAIYTAFEELQKQGKDIAFTHFNYIFPLPKNTETILKSAKNVLICEMNDGQFAKYLRTNFPQIEYQQFNKMQAQPFMVNELIEKFNEILETK